MFQVTDNAKTLLQNLLSEEPKPCLRIQFNPGCGVRSFQIGVADVRFGSDVEVHAEGFTWIFSKNLGHLLENAVIDCVQTDDGEDWIGVLEDEGC